MILIGLYNWFYDISLYHTLLMYNTFSSKIRTFFPALARPIPVLSILTDQDLRDRPVHARLFRYD